VLRLTNIEPLKAPGVREHATSLEKFFFLLEAEINLRFLERTIFASW
jgi:hypothetical protein